MRYSITAINGIATNTARYPKEKLPLSDEELELVASPSMGTGDNVGVTRESVCGGIVSLGGGGRSTGGDVGVVWVTCVTLGAANWEESHSSSSQPLSETTQKK